MINYTSFPNLETKNLLLRRIEQNDESDLYAMRKDSSMHTFTDTKVDGNIDETIAYMEKMNQGTDEKKWIIWAIEHKQTKKVIGTISIWNLNKEEKSGELGYGIIPAYQGQGLMRESLLRVIEYGFEVMNLEKIQAYTEENNRPSISLLEKCDFVEIGRVNEQGYTNNKDYCMIVYQLVR
ncbi:GNAT family N-acetyltransferase [Psychrobacillus sp. NPDC058041]|uniref:GNAT family N-acetyltransferase n=1 Tax=Psychrobacillus sp. NPDC058041 TaxID=3346310 RepID=UPI0036D9EFE8